MHVSFNIPIHLFSLTSYYFISWLYQNFFHFLFVLAWVCPRAELSHGSECKNGSGRRSSEALGGSEEVKLEKEENGVGCINNGLLSGVTGVQSY